MSLSTTTNVRTVDHRRRNVRRAVVTAQPIGFILVAVIAVILIGAAGVGHSVTTARQQATPTTTARHPLVGTWIVDPEVDDASNPPSFDAYMADGTLVNIGSDGATVGAWDITGPRTATLTFAGLIREEVGAAFINSRERRGRRSGRELHRISLVYACRRRRDGPGSVPRGDDPRYAPPRRAVGGRRADAAWITDMDPGHSRDGYPSLIANRETDWIDGPGPVPGSSTRQQHRLPTTQKRSTVQLRYGW